MFEKNFYCVSSRIENSGQLYGCFKIGPFSRHQSLTFANALRRTLLADRSRCTLSAVQINDVEHEFSSLIGVRESVVDILLNLEKLIFKIKKPITKPQVAFINFCGPGILRAQHIYLPSNFQCVRPSQYIATLEVDGKLTLKLFFSPDWNKFQFFIQNIIFATKEDPKNHYFKHSNKKKKTGLGPWAKRLTSLRDATSSRSEPKRLTSPQRPEAKGPSDRQKNIKKLLKYTDKNLFKEIYRYRSILHRKLHQSSKAKRSANRIRHSGYSKPSVLPLLGSTNGGKARRAPSQKTLASVFSITQILKNRLKIVNYLTNILFKSGHSSYLQRLNVQFQFLNLKTMTIQKSPKSNLTSPLAKQSAWPPPIFSSAKFSDNPKFVPYRNVQYSKQHTKTNYKKTGLGAGTLFLKNQKTISLRIGPSDLQTRRQDVSPVFAQKIQENFLFLNGSQCAIEKVNYTLQSNILGASASEENPHQVLPFDQRLTHFSFDPKEPSEQTLAKDDFPRLALGAPRGGQAASQALSPSAYFPRPHPDETTGNAPRRASSRPSPALEVGFADPLSPLASPRRGEGCPSGEPSGPSDSSLQPLFTKGEGGLPANQPNNLKKSKRINNFAEKKSFHLKCHLKINSQRKLRGNIQRTRFASEPHRISPSTQGFRAIQPVFKEWNGESKADRRLISQNEEFILFEIWTDGSILPQTAFLRALNELLLEIFPYSLQISKYEKVNSILNNKPHYGRSTGRFALMARAQGKRNDKAFGAPKYADRGSTKPSGHVWQAFSLSGFAPKCQQAETSLRDVNFHDLNRKNSLKFIQNSLKRRNSDLSKKSFREKFLNLEIGNFYFDLETYLFLKKRKIHRIIDFLKFLNQKETTKLIVSQQSFKNHQKTKGIKMTLDQFQIFLNSLIG